MRPTGRLHIGHYFGALQNWVSLQNEVLPSGETQGSSSPLATRHSPLLANDCFYFVADWHALTSDYAELPPSPKTLSKSPSISWPPA